MTREYMKKLAESLWSMFHGGKGMNYDANGENGIHGYTAEANRIKSQYGKSTWNQIKKEMDAINNLED